MTAAPVIHIGGWPGAGKRTIGRIVADRLGGRLIDNHLMLDAARAIYARGTPGSMALREEVRELILSHARRLPADVPMVLTDALAQEPEAGPLFRPTVALARDRAAPLLPFVLELSLEENQRRLTDPSRLGGAKLTDVDVLFTLRQKSGLYLPTDAIVLDVTTLSADDVAEVICTRVAASHG
ncbi:MAG: nucleoside kinase [Pseudomonadota bacterium]